MTHEEIDSMYSYAIGYYQGRHVGTYEYDGYESMSDQEQHLYRLGYDRGVADYCEFDTESDPMDDFNYVGSPAHY
jgi:hypothetical protein